MLSKNFVLLDDSLAGGLDASLKLQQPHYDARALQEHLRYELVNLKRT